MWDRSVLNWAIAFLLIGIAAGITAFTGASSGVWTFLLLTLFVVLLLVGTVPLIAGPRGRGKMT